jgi:hypothetical protein
MKKEIKKVENLVIGGNLAALEFAYREGFPIFYEKLEVPFQLDQTVEGTNKKDIIENYAFMLSLAGLNLHSHIVAEHRLANKKLVLTGRVPWSIEYRYEKLHDFRERNTKNKLYKVVDYIDVRSCGTHDIRELKRDDNFVKEIYFYPSQRSNNSKRFDALTHNYELIPKDAMLVSYLKGKELEKEEFSPIYSRLILKETMKEVGIKGKSRGFEENGKPRPRGAIKLEFSKREINEIEEHDRNYYYAQSKHPYLNKLFGHMYGKTS